MTRHRTSISFAETVRSMRNITMRDETIISAGTDTPASGPDDTCSITFRRRADAASHPLLCRSLEKLSFPQNAHFHCPVYEDRQCWA